MAGKEGARGRPRSEDSRLAILTATRDLLREVGYERLTIVAVAARAGSGKQTVYRWWRTKAELVAECVITGMMDIGLVIAEPSGDVAADLSAWLDRSYASLSSPQLAPLVQALTAASAADPAAAARLSERFASPLRAGITAVLQAGEDAGTVRPGVDPTAVSDLLLGALIFDVLARDAAAPRRAPAVTSILVDGLRPRP